jgi:hypothetical protein
MMSIAPSNARSTDQQLTLWKFESAKWPVLQTTEMIGFRAWLGVRDDFRNWLLTAA